MKYAFLALVCIHVLCAPRAHAQRVDHAAVGEHAQRVDHAAVGQSDFSAGRYREALDHFSRAYEASGAPILLYNIGQSADRLRLDATTLRAFQLYLQRYPDAPNREEVRHRIEVLTPRVATQRQALDAVRVAEEAEVRGRPAVRAKQTIEARVSVSETLLPSPYRESTQKRERAPEPDLVHNVWFWVAAGAIVVAVVCTAVLITSDAPSSSSGGTSNAGVGSAALVHHF